MLLGEYEHTIDDKNRLTLPARFRQSFADGVVVTRGIEPCLAVYTRGGWEDFVSSRLAGLDRFSREARDMRRYLFSATVEAELDKQGRVTLPAGLMAKAALLLATEPLDQVTGRVTYDQEILKEFGWIESGRGIGFERKGSGYSLI